MDGAAWFSPAGGLQIGRSAKTSTRALFAKGFLVEFANPKALLYFAAILPQFIDPARPMLTQFLIMGFTTLAFDFLAYSAYGAMGSSIAKSGIRPSAVRWINRLAGGALIFAAFRIAKTAA